MSTNSPLPGVKVLLQGGSGTGKTTSIKTLIDAGITPMCVFTENSFDVLGDTPPERLHWCYVPPARADLKQYLETIKPLSYMSPDQVQKTHDMTRQRTNQFDPMLAALFNYKCERTGQTFGNAGEWGTDKALVIDSLSGLTIAAVKFAVGEKYAMTQPEYQIAMKVIENLIMQICTGFRCHFVLTAHIEREADEVLGGSRVMASTLGRKLAPVLPRFFTDVIWAKRSGTKFYWDTADPQADLKSRNLGIGSEFPQSFVPLIKKWQERGGVIDPAR